MTGGGRLTIPRSLAAFRTRAALGLRRSVAPVSLFGPLGAALGPLGFGAIPIEAIAHLDIGVSIALATLGVLIGIACAREVPGASRTFLAASAESLVTLALVAIAASVLVTAWQVPLPSPVAVGLMLGLSAAVSSAPPDGLEFDPHRHAVARIADLDDVAPIAVGFVASVALWAPPGHAVAHGAAAAGAALAVAGAGWLLFEHTADRAERGVFVLGVLALLGGSATYLGGSPLASGFLAGLLWTLLPGRADRVIADDLARFHQPLVVLLLIVAGALWKPSVLALWLLVPFLLFRLTGKWLGGWAAARVAGPLGAAEVGAGLLWPGVVGVAFALAAYQVAPAEVAEPVLAAVLMGAAASEGLALVLAPPDTSA